MKAMRGQQVTECAYISSSLTRLPFFASPVRLGPNGIEEILPLPSMQPMEEKWFQEMLPELQASIEKGIAFVKG
jgi:malate/lactate dehydrogenase